MSTRQQFIAGVVGFGLIGLYSWIMTASDGTTSWAWIILVAAVVLLGWTARMVAKARERRGA